MIARLKNRLRIPFSALLDLLSRWSRRPARLAVVYHRIDDRQEDRKGDLVAALGTSFSRRSSAT